MHNGTPFEVLEFLDDSWLTEVTEASAEFAYETDSDPSCCELSAVRSTTNIVRSQSGCYRDS